MERVPDRRLFSLSVVLLFSLVTASIADEVTVKGVRLTGKVKEVKPSGIVFETELGSGTIEIPYSDIESIRTDEDFLILHGDEGRATGKLVGVEDGNLVVRQDGQVSSEIVPETIVLAGLLSEEGSLDDKLRQQFRYWKGSVDFGLSFKDSTTDQTDITAGIRFERRKKPTRLLLEGFYLYGREKAKGEPSTTTDNEIRGLVKGEWDPFERLFLYTSHDLEYDETDKLSLRWVAKLGPGYKLFDTERFRLQVESGGAYTYERFFGGDVEESVGIAFGTEGMVAIAYGATVTFRADYLPAIDDWTDDYLIRGQATLDVPISEYLSLRTSVFDTYDNTPAEGSDKNEAKVILSLAWRF